MEPVHVEGVHSAHAHAHTKLLKFSLVPLIFLHSAHSQYFCLHLRPNTIQVSKTTITFQLENYKILSNFSL